MNFLQQTKLTKDEWDKIEKPIESDKEKSILEMIQQGYENENVTYNPFATLRDFLNIQREYDAYIFDSILKERLEKLEKKVTLFPKKSTSKPKSKEKAKPISKGDQIKMKNSLKLFEKKNCESDVIEFVFLNELKHMAKVMTKHKDDYVTQKKYIHALYNIYILRSMYQEVINEVFRGKIDTLWNDRGGDLHVQRLLSQVPTYLEHNPIFNYRCDSLYSHQKDIFRIFKEKESQPKLVFYCAPTSSGKTLSPLALTQDYKVLFVCASKHIGLSLAKSAFHLQKKLGFAFGCHDVDQIRLNYNAVNSYIKKGWREVPDHSDGKKVELMICDMLSFENAMRYMKAFHPLEKILLFWDEPTIGLDVESHPLHDQIKKNWALNQIPNVVFSCATLPKQDKIQCIVTSFETKFPGSYFEYIETHDQVTNLMIYDEFGNVLMPHMYFEDHGEMCAFLEYQDKKYYKFYNAGECATFLMYYDKKIDPLFLGTHFPSIEQYTIEHIKDKYVYCLKQISSELWCDFRKGYLDAHPLKTTPHDMIGTNLTTNQARGLTNGPTLYISDQTENICKFLLHIAKMDPHIVEKIQEKIDYNAKISEQLMRKRKDYEDKIEKFKDNEKVMENMRFPPDIMDLHRDIEGLQHKLQDLRIDNVYKPNTRDHFKKWTRGDEGAEYDESDVFTSHIGDTEVKDVMQLYTVHALYKILLLMGIGVFSNELIQMDKVDKEDKRGNENKKAHDIKEENNQYVEIMKQLAEQKALYLIIANSDYIYGTNYQFSHCYLGKDMQNLSQEKIIQCIGRIGRQDKNKHFSFRFRSKEHIKMLYEISEYSIEATNMNGLFS